MKTVPYGGKQVPIEFTTKSQRIFKELTGQDLMVPKGNEINDHHMELIYALVCGGEPFRGPIEEKGFDQFRDSIPAEDFLLISKTVIEHYFDKVGKMMKVAGIDLEKAVEEAKSKAEDEVGK